VRIASTCPESCPAWKACWKRKACYQLSYWIPLILENPKQYFFWHSGERIPYSLAVRLRMEKTPEKQSAKKKLLDEHGMVTLFDRELDVVETR
jgi:hypothetical protein